MLDQYSVILVLVYKPSEVRLASGSQVLCSSPNPCHLTRYMVTGRPLPRVWSLWESIVSTIYSGKPSTKTVNGSWMGGPSHSFSSDIWKTGCIFQAAGRSSSTADVPMRRMTLNGPRYLGRSLGVPVVAMRMFFDDKRTF